MREENENIEKKGQIRMTGVPRIITWKGWGVCYIFNYVFHELSTISKLKEEKKHRIKIHPQYLKNIYYVSDKYTHITCSSFRDMMYECKTIRDKYIKCINKQYKKPRPFGCQEYQQKRIPPKECLFAPLPYVIGAVS